MALDPPAPESWLLENLDWIRRLARALSGDEDRAEDLVQETWLRASRAEVPAGPRARPWLARVMCNLARDARRGERRRAEREQRAARPEALAPSDEALALAVERQGRLVAWVMELDEPFRRAVLLRWFEGLAPSEIAAREGLPLATVRSRLRRAHARLRERVERESGGRRDAWLAVLALPAGLPRAESSLLLPLFVMKAKSLVALAAALVLTLSLWSVLREPARVPPAGSVSQAEPRLAAERELASESERGEERRAAAAIEERAATPPPAAATPEPLLVLRVVDASGEPVAGVPVALFVGAGEGEEDPEVERVTEGPLGEVRFEEPTRGFSELVRLGAIASDRPVFAGLGFPGVELPRVPLDLGDLPREPVVLELPPTGALLVRLRTPGGEPLPVSTWLHATPLREHPTDPVRRLRGTRFGRYLEDQSEARFPHVGLGLELRVQLQDAGLLRGASVDVAGPARPGETRTVQLVLGEIAPHVRGRLVDEAGAPIATPWMDAEFDSGGSARCLVEPDGRFELSLARRRGEGGQVEARVVLGLPSEPLVGAFLAAMPQAGQGVDVGDVVLRPPSAVAEGRVVDASGAPVEGARLAVYDKINQREDPEVFDWSFAGVPYAYSDAEGRFVVRGELPPGEYALRALAEGWADRGALRFQAGARGLELVLDRAEIVSGTLRLPEGVPTGELRLTALYEGATREQRAYASWRAGVEPDGDFLIEGLRPGAVTLRLHRGGSDAVLAALEGVPTATPDEPGDARLRPWDLTRRLVPIDLELRLAAPGAMAYLATERAALVARGGRCHWLLTDELRELTAGAPGHVSKSLDPRALPEFVRLARGPAVRVAMQRPLPALPEGWRVEVTLAPQEEPAPPVPLLDASGGSVGWLDAYARHERVPLAPGATSCVVHACAPGPHRVVWLVIRPPDDPALGGGGLAPVSTSTGWYDIDVPPPGAGAIEVARDFDEARLRAAIEGLR